jgi:predicted lipoprotein with Yx(FWY)xxD motif
MAKPLSSAKLRLAVKLGAPLAAAGILAAACSSGGSSNTASNPAPPASSATPAGSSASTVDVRTTNGTQFLTDKAGRSLYLWVPDTKTKSMCSGPCAAAWPPLTTTGAPTAGMGATAADLGTINRSDGTKQVTYGGHPLYYYAGDSAPGQTSGEGSTGFGAPWYLVAPSGKQITNLSAAAAPAKKAPVQTAPATSAPTTSTGGSNAGGGWS